MDKQLLLIIGLSSIAVYPRNFWFQLISGSMYDGDQCLVPGAQRDHCETRCGEPLCAGSRCGERGQVAAVNAGGEGVRMVKKSW